MLVLELASDHHKNEIGLSFRPCFTVFSLDAMHCSLFASSLFVGLSLISISASLESPAFSQELAVSLCDFRSRGNGLSAFCSRKCSATGSRWLFALATPPATCSFPQLPRVSFEFALIEPPLS